MSDVTVIRTLEELYKYLNDNGILEVVIRDKNKRFKVFKKIALSGIQQPESIQTIKKALETLEKSVQNIDKGIGTLKNINKLGKLNIILNGIDLCATCVGFAIMYEQLDKMSAQINQVIRLNKDIEGVNVNYEYNKILSEYSNMLDCRKTKNYYSVEQMRSLVASEYDVLKLLTDVFMKEIAGDKDILIASMLSLASMLTVSLKYFDETYYFKNKEVIGDGDKWHIDHGKWVSALDRMSGPEFIKMIQDYGIFDKELNTVENDCFYKNIYDQIRGFKQEIEDNQRMIVTVDDQEILRIINEKTIEDIRKEIEKAFDSVGADISMCDGALRAAVA